jgi:hypothetical protein
MQWQMSSNNLKNVPILRIGLFNYFFILGSKPGWDILEQVRDSGQEQEKGAGSEDCGDGGEVRHRLARNAKVGGNATRSKFILVI